MYQLIYPQKLQLFYREKKEMYQLIYPQKLIIFYREKREYVL